MALLLSKSAFIHIPKCGGQSVRLALLNAGFDCARSNETGSPDLPFNRRSHAKLKDVVSECDGRKLFTFIREPIPWYRSYWSHRHDEAWTVPQYAEEREAWGDGKKTFSEWVESICELHPGFLSRLYGDYCGINGTVTIGMTEFLETDLNAAMYSFGETDKWISVPRVNCRKSLPDITGEHARMIIHSESVIYERVFDNRIQTNQRMFKRCLS